MTNKLIVYSTEDCRPCRAAKKHLDAAGIAYESVSLEQDDAARQRLKAVGMLQSPVFRWAGAYLTIADLPRIVREAKEAA